MPRSRIAALSETCPIRNFPFFVKKARIPISKMTGIRIAMDRKTVLIMKAYLSANIGEIVRLSLFFFVFL